MTFRKMPFTPTLARQYLEQFGKAYGLIASVKPAKRAISPSESHSAAPHIIYLPNRPTPVASEPVDGKEYRVKRPDPKKMCF